MTYNEFEYEIKILDGSLRVHRISSDFITVEDTLALDIIIRVATQDTHCLDCAWELFRLHKNKKELFNLTIELAKTPIVERGEIE